MAWLTPNIRNKVVGDWSIAPFKGIGATLPAPYTSFLAAIVYAAGAAFSSNGSINLFWSPTGAQAAGASFGLSKPRSVGSATSNISVTVSYYWQDAPSNSVKFE